MNIFKERSWLDFIQQQCWELCFHWNNFMHPKFGNAIDALPNIMNE